MSIDQPYQDVFDTHERQTQANQGRCKDIGPLNLRCCREEGHEGVHAKGSRLWPEEPRDYGLEAQQAAESHLTAVWNHFHAQQEGDGEYDEENPAVGLFDGCQTCEVREVLAAAWPIIQEGVAAGDLTLDDIKRAGAHDDD